MSKYTPGPWMIDRFKGQPPYLVANKTEVVCLLGNHERMENDKREANARLIAASPDLLKACKALLKSIDCAWQHSLGISCRAARAAIAKAEEEL